MPIVYPLTMPEYGVSQYDLTYITTDAMTESPSTGSQQIQVFDRELWKLKITLGENFYQEEFDEWSSFLMSLSGRFGTFLAGDPLRLAPLGNANGNSGSPEIYNNISKGKILNLRNCTPSISKYLKRGDYIQIGTGSASRLHKVVLDVDTDSSGNCVVDIVPRLRQVYPNGQSVSLNNCRGLFRLTSNEINMQMRDLRQFGLEFEAVEVL